MTLAANPLPSWRDATAKRRIVAFVEAVATPGSKDWVPPPERIAVFDNDGTLWSEQVSSRSGSRRVTEGPGPRLGMLVHHDDAEREYAYDRESPFGRLGRGLDEAPARGWTVVSMERDWTRVFPEATR